MLEEKRENEICELIAQRSQAHVRELLAAYFKMKERIAELTEEVNEFDATLSETIEINTKPLREEIARLRGLLGRISTLAGSEATPIIRLGEGSLPPPKGYQVSDPDPNIGFFLETREEFERSPKRDVEGCYQPVYEARAYEGQEVEV